MRLGLVAGLLAAPLFAACTPLLAPPPAAVLVPDEEKLEFGRVYVGTTRTWRFVRWKNVSPARITVTGINTIPAVSPFTVNLRQPFTPFAVDPGKNTPLFNFAFRPTEAGAASAQGIPQQAAGAAQGVMLTGEGVFQISDGNLAVGGRDLVAGAALDFGKVQVPDGSNIKTFNLTNRSNDIIAVRGYFADGKQGFKIVSPTPPFAISAGGSVVVAIIFRPPDVGMFSDGITFVDGMNPANQAGTALKGEGVPRTD